MSNHKDLSVWTKAIALASKVYAATRDFPKEDLGLGQELRRSAVCVARYIAEGSARRNSAEFMHCLTLARGSLSEFETHLAIALDQGLLRDDTNMFTEEAAGLETMLSGLIHSLSQARQAAHAKACHVPTSRNPIQNTRLGAGVRPRQI